MVYLIEFLIQFNANTYSKEINDIVNLEEVECISQRN